MIECMMGGIEEWRQMDVPSTEELEARLEIVFYPPEEDDLGRIKIDSTLPRLKPSWQKATRNQVGKGYRLDKRQIMFY